MYTTSWLYFKILLPAISVFGAFSQNSTNSLRTIYVTPADSASQVSCPVDYCYNLEDVLSNSSYFFDSNTTLELLPGMHNITEKVGQLVLIKVVNFTLKGSSSNVTVICQPDTTWGLTVINSLWIEISNIQISNCSAKMKLKGSNNTILMDYNKKVGQYLEYNLSSCELNDNIHHPACYAFLTIYKTKKITIHQTSISYSRGVGIFSLGSNGLEISKTVLAYNKINCINMLLGTTSTTFNMSHSQIKFGQIIYGFEFASGLNLFVHLDSKTHNISLTNITLANNRGALGNFYMAVHCQSGSDIDMDIDLNILITNISSIQTVEKIASSGMVIKYDIRLEDTDKDRTIRKTFNVLDQWLFGYNPYDFMPLKCHMKYYYLHDPDCFYWFMMPGTPLIDATSQTKRVYISLQNGHFRGSCVIIRDSELSIKRSQFRFEMNNVTISESKCPTALSVINSEINNYLTLLNLIIVNSHSNMLLINIPSRYSSKLILTGNTYFLSNQGSVSLLSGSIKFEGFVLISGNTAQKYESVFKVSDSNEVYFEGEIQFIDNTGRQGGAISAYSSNLYFEGNVSFIGNSADNGGAISLKEGATINLKGDTHIIFTNNVAEMYGGGIYIEDAGLWVRRKVQCFLHTDNKNGHIKVKFENNTAERAGAALFGGWIDFCETHYGIKPSDILKFKTDNSVGSYPTRVCMCTNSRLNKEKTEGHVEVFPGQTFEIEVVAVGQRFGMIPASVRAETAENNVINQLQKLQDTENQCTKLKITVRPSNRNETMLLSVDGQTRPKWINESIDIPDEFLQFNKVLTTLKECPLDFEFDSGR